MNNPITQLSQDEQRRYAPHLKLDEIGLIGQQKLKNARVLCIGAGGLASPLLLYLAAAGVGTLGIVDDDIVELENLQRQILFQNHHLSQSKVEVAAQQLFALNENIQIHTYQTKFNLDNAQDLCQPYNIIADCSDNFFTRYLVNDVCFKLQKPYVHASIFKFEGQCSFFSGKNPPCLRCLFPVTTDFKMLPNCHDTGVIGVLPGLLGVIQATEIIKWILQMGELLIGRLLRINLLKMQFDEFQFKMNPDCDLCIHQQPLASLKRPNDCFTDPTDAITAAELHSLINKNDQQILLLDVRTIEEHLIFNLGDKIIPVDELAVRLNELDRSQLIVTYCQKGPRSQAAYQILKNANFPFVKYLLNGLPHSPICS